MDESGLIGSAELTGSDRCIPDGRTHSYVIHDQSDQNGPKITVPKMIYGQSNWLSQRFMLGLDF